LPPAWLVVTGLAIFGFAFAVISSLHSYLILVYAGSKKAAEDVGFYYAANATGRLFGIVMSGLLTQNGGSRLAYGARPRCSRCAVCWCSGYQPKATRIGAPPCPRIAHILKICKIS